MFILRHSLAGTLALCSRKVKKKEEKGNKFRHPWPPPVTMRFLPPLPCTSMPNPSKGHLFAVMQSHPQSSLYQHYAAPFSDAVKFYYFWRYRGVFSKFAIFLFPLGGKMQHPTS
jgi:hypothetical protein